mgnify:FL=1
MDIFQYWNTHYEIGPEKQIICKDTKQPYKIVDKDIWIVFKTDEDYIALPNRTIREIIYPNIPLFSPNCLGWTNDKYDNPTEAINERICNCILSKTYDERIGNMLLYTFRKNGMKYLSRVPTMLMLCIANLYVNIRKNGMLITDCEYPPHILQQMCYPFMYHGWYSLDKNRPNDILYGTVNRKIWISCVAENRDAYKDDKDLVYAGIFLNFIKRDKIGYPRHLPKLLDYTQA